MKKIRDDIKSDETFWQNKPRLGLFSYTASNSPGAIRDSSESDRRLDRWKVRLDPKNFATGKSDVFAKTGFLNAKFVDASKIKTWRAEDTEALKKFHKNAFRSGILPKSVKGPYEYVPHNPKEGPVVGFGKRGMYNNGPKSGMGNHNIGHLFEKFTYSEDPYDNQRVQDAKDRESSMKKRGGRGAFTSTSTKRDFFASNKDLYGRPDNSTASPDNAREGRSTPKLNQKAFVPSSPAKNGYNRTFGKYPEYMSDPLPIIDPDRDRKKEKIWRTSYKLLTGPSVSVKQYNTQFRPTGKV